MSKSTGTDAREQGFGLHDEMDKLSGRMHTTLQLSDGSGAGNSSGGLASHAFSLRRKQVPAAPNNGDVPSSLQALTGAECNIEVVKSNAVAASTSDGHNSPLDATDRGLTEPHQHLTYQDSSKFQGQLTPTGMPAHGTLTYATGNFYNGPFKDGLPSGQGTLRIDVEGQQGGWFEGQFIAGAPDNGTFRADNGDVYKGTVTPDGFAKRGIKTEPDGTVSEGTWLVDENDKGSFDGTIRSGEDGSTFEGSIRLYTKVTGTTRWPDGGWFTGTYGEESRLKCGTYIFPDGVTIDATWDDHANPIEGTQTFPSGEVFKGTFLGLRKHKGTLNFIDGSVFTGTFATDGTSKGSRRKKGVMTYPDGSTFSGDFFADQLDNGIRKWKEKGKLYSYEGQFDINGKIKRDTDGTLPGTLYENGVRIEGTNTTKDGAVFRGTFRPDGTRNRGVARFRDGGSYKGVFINNLMADGTYVWPNGNTFTGAFSNGKISDGKMTFAETGSVYLGTFFRDDDPLDGNLTTASGIVWKYRGGRRKRNKQVEARERQATEQRLRENGGRLDGGTADRVRGQTNHAANTAMFWQLYNNS